jgi:hypothetical protein
MKTNSHFSLIFTTTFILFLFLSVNTSAQLNWNKYEDNPVMEGIAGAWNQGVWNPVVIYENSLFKMWYMGRYYPTDTRQIGYATSPDGINWNMEDYPDPVIPGGAVGQWNHHKYPGTVLRINDTIKMWYWVSTNSANNGSICYAWAVEENQWNELPEAVLTKGEGGEWDDFMITGPRVYYDEVTMVYHMYYSGCNNSFSFDIGHATSLDGIHWTKDYLFNPVLVTGVNGLFYDEWIMSGGLVKYDDTLRMYFTGYDGAYYPATFDGYFRTGYAWSTNYIIWTIGNNSEPVVDVGEPGKWDDVWAGMSSIIVHNNQLKMWYMGKVLNGAIRIGYAMSDSVIITGFSNKYELHNNLLRISPSPFTGHATLVFELYEKSRVQLDVYNLNGLLVSSLVNEVREQGKHEVIFDGNELQPGVYFCVLKTNEGVQTKKMIKL